MTIQPRWRMVANLGDVNPVDYGGYFVYVDQTGVYPPELEVLESPNSDDDGTGWTLYRLILEPHTYVDGVLSDNPFHPGFPVWYADKLESVAQTIGSTSLSLINDLTSDNPLHKARAYIDLISYFGAFEFDQYPTQYMRRSHLPRRIRRHKEKR